MYSMNRSFRLPRLLLLAASLAALILVLDPFWK